jgi:hypothetical protein
MRSAKANGDAFNLVVRAGIQQLKVYLVAFGVPVAQRCALSIGAHWQAFGRESGASGVYEGLLLQMGDEEERGQHDFGALVRFGITYARKEGYQRQLETLEASLPPGRRQFRSRPARGRRRMKNNYYSLMTSRKHVRRIYLRSQSAASDSNNLFCIKTACLNSHV